MFKTDKDFRLTMVGTDICGACGGIGLSFHDIDDVQGLSFNEITLRQTHALEEMWVIDRPPENLSGRHRNRKFDWTKKPE
jgi:hypothetical protein